MNIIHITNNRVDMVKQQIAAFNNPVDKHYLVCADCTDDNFIKYQAILTTQCIRHITSDHKKGKVPRFFMTLDWVWKNIVLNMSNEKVLIIEDDMLPLPNFNENVLFKNKQIPFIIRSWGGLPWPGILAVNLKYQTKWGNLHFDSTKWMKGSCITFLKENQIPYTLLNWSHLNQHEHLKNFQNSDISPLTELIDNLFIHLNGGKQRWENYKNIQHPIITLTKEQIDLRSTICRSCKEFVVGFNLTNDFCYAKEGCHKFYISNINEKCVLNKWS